MSSLMEMLSQSISPQQIQQLAQRIGATPEQTEQAVGLALPTLLGALARHADDDQQAAQLHAAVGQQASSGSEPGGTPGDTSGATAQGLLPEGILPGGLGDLLGSVLGGRQGRVEQGIGKASGLSAGQVTTLLAVLGPMIMSMLGRLQSQGTGSAKDLQETLRKERTQMQNQAGGGLLAGLLDQDGDGDFDVQDVVKLGMKKLFGRK